MSEFIKKAFYILEKDKRYKLQAYIFTVEALHYKLKKIGKKRHLTARELLEGIVELGRKKYGLLAYEVFKSWGCRKTDDFGEIVFNLIEMGELSKTEEDKKEDFYNVFDLREELEKNYRFKE